MFAYRLMGTRKTFTEGVDWREEPGVTSGTPALAQLFDELRVQQRCRVHHEVKVSLKLLL